MVLFEGVDGIKVYDPRKDERVVSDNPALLLGYMVEKSGAIVGEGFWPGIARLANLCDGGVNDESEEPVP
jgi:hypothetical protein